MPERNHAFRHNKTLKNFLEYPAIQKMWLTLALLYVSLLLHLAFYLQAPGRAYSASLKILTIAVIGIALGVFAVTLFWARIQAFVTRVGQIKRMSGFVLAGGLAALFIFGMLIRPEWFYAQLALTLAATLVVVTYTLPLCLPQLGQREWLSALFVLVGVITLVRLRSLSYYPSLHPIDEPWVLGWALSIIRSGRLSDWIMVDRDISINVYYALVGGWLKVLGVGLWQGRAFSFVLVHVVIILTALAANNLYGKRTAWFTAAALFSSVIMISGARLRHDIGLAVSVAAALWLWSEANKRCKSSLHFASGLALGSGLASHYHAPFFGVALTLAFYGPALVMGRESRQRTFANLVLFGVGGLAAAILIIAIQPIPSGGPAAYLPSNALSEWLEGVRRYFVNISQFSKYESALIAFGVAAALLRRGKPDIAVICAGVLAHLGLAIASPSGLGMYYLVPVTPFYGLLVGSLFGKGLGRSLGRMLTVSSGMAVVICTVFLVINLGDTLHTPLSQLSQDSALEPAPTAPAQWVLDNIPPGSIIVGEHIHYLWLTDYRYVSPLAPNLMKPSLRAQFDTLPAVWEDINPDVFMVDDAGSTYPLLSPLVDVDYFEWNGYVEAARFDATRIYIRQP
jgi:hypothetical protein